MMSFLAQTRKAVGTLIVGVYGWAQYVVTSAPGKITSGEWMILAGVGVAVAACYGLTNAEPPAPVPLAPKPLQIHIRDKGPEVIAPPEPEQHG